jgi:hypothetical protein
MQKYSPFGVAFRKKFLTDHGALPVMYIPEVGRPSIVHFSKPGTTPSRGISSQAIAFNRFWKYFNKIERSIKDLKPGHRVLADDLRRLFTFLDLSLLSHLKFFDHRLPDDHPHNYYMEREWRTTQDVSFDLIDIQRIIIPTRFSRRFRNAFKTYDGEVFFAD